MSSIKKHLILLIISVGISTLISAQSVEEIIAKHIEAHGGAEKWDAISSMTIKGQFTAFSEEHEFYAIKSNKGEYYSELNIGQHRLKEAFDGSKGWTDDPWFELPYPRELNKVEINAFYQKAEFFTPFYKYKEKGHKVAFMGEESVDGVDTYIIKLTRNNGYAETWYLDKNTYLETKSVSEWTDFALANTAESFYEDFRTVDGLVIPFFIERMFRQRDRMLVIEDIVFNTFDNSEILEMPKSEQMNKLAFLVGNWDVKIEKLNRRNALYTLDNTESIFSFESTNLLKQKLSFDDYFTQSMILNYSFNSTKNKYIMTAYNVFGSATDIFEGSIKDGVFIADNANIKIGDSALETVAMQISLSEMSDDSFIMELKSSSDQGKTWNMAYKMTYTRK